MATLKFTGNLTRMTVTLASAYTAGSGTMTLTSGHGARLPTTGDFWLVPTSGTYQSIKVTARSTDTLTVVGSQDGTTDASLSTGAELEWNLTASALTQLQYDIQRTSPLVAPPVASAFTATNTGSSTITDSGSGPVVIAFLGGGSTLRMYEKATPGTSFTFTAKWAAYGSANYLRIGMFVRRTANSKLMMYGYRADGGHYAVDLWTTLASWSSSSSLLANIAFYGPVPTWHRIVVDATNIAFYYSQDGQTWYLQHTQTIASWLGGACDYLGFVCYDNGSGPAGLTIESMEVL